MNANAARHVSPEWYRAMATKVPRLNMPVTRPPRAPRPALGQASATCANPNDHSPPVPMPATKRKAKSGAIDGTNAMSPVATE